MKTNLSIKDYREAVKLPPIGAPTAATASAVWALVGPVLTQAKLGVRGRVPLTLDEIATSLLPRLAEDEKAMAKTTAQKALVVALDAVIVAGRDRRVLTVNMVADALARRWSPTFRNAKPARTL